MATVNLKLNGCISSMNLSRNLERIFEDCARSGELKLTNRKLKEFPKTYGKFNLSDTIFADLSRNRFCELPEDVTAFIFLEQLFLYQNTMKMIPQSIRNLTSLTFLDLRSNQLVSLPREICFLPIQILLVSNNKLVQLPEELGKMSELTELDAGVNQLSHLPSRLCDLTKLRSLCLRNNQINFLPKEISSLNLVSLDLSCNKISSLPLEIRFMNELIDLNLTDNPLTSPPAQLCSKGTVFIFKYLETAASKDMKSEGSNSLRRSIGRKSSHQIYESMKPKNNISPDNVDYNFEPLAKLDIVPNSFHLRTELSKSDTSTPTQGFPSALNDALLDNDLLKRKLESRTIIKSDPTSMNNISVSPDAVNSKHESNHKTPEKLKSVAENIQTYREYKEALKQQRSNDLYSIYKCRDTLPIERSNSENSNLNGNNESSQSSNGIDIRDEKISPLSNNEKNLQNGNGTHEENTYMKPNSPLKLSKSNGQHRAANANMNGGNKGQIRNKITSNSRLWDGQGNEKLSFTMRREFDRHREEAELMKQLKNIIETKLKMKMPEDIGQALNDGVVLCHLANHVKAQSVGSIHVPSANVPKLTMARCRRNVDNFLEACRKIGVDEENDVQFSSTLLEQAFECCCFQSSLHHENEDFATNPDVICNANNQNCPSQHYQLPDNHGISKSFSETPQELDLQKITVTDYEKKLSNILLLIFVLTLSIATAISIWP